MTIKEHLAKRKEIKERERNYLANRNKYQYRKINLKSAILIQILKDNEWVTKRTFGKSAETEANNELNRLKAIA